MIVAYQSMLSNRLLFKDTHLSNLWLLHMKPTANAIPLKNLEDFSFLSSMKSTVSILCMGMVTAKFGLPFFGQNADPQPVPVAAQPLPAGMSFLDCLAGQCPRTAYIGKWKATLVDQDVMKSIGCYDLKYFVTVSEKLANGGNAESMRRNQMNPDHYRMGAITEVCILPQKNPKGEHQTKTVKLEATGTSVKLVIPGTPDNVTPVGSGLGFHLPIAPAMPSLKALLVFEKVWVLNNQVVAAVVQQPLFSAYAEAETTVGKGKFTAVKSLWVKDLVNLSDDRRKQFLDIAAHIVFKSV